MAVPFDEYQKKRNSEFYKAKGAGFEKEFKTFAYDARFAEALAKDFYKRFSGSEKETLDVYEFGIGDGSLGIRFLMELRKIGHRLVEKTVYRFCDFSDELVKHAVKRADAFGFNADGIVYDAIYLPAAVFDDFINDVRNRMQKGLRLAEEFAKDNRPDNDEKLRKLREKYRSALRSGLLDSREDFELLLLAKEIEATLVTSDEGVMKFADSIGCEWINASRFHDLLTKMKKKK